VFAFRKNNRPRNRSILKKWFSTYQAPIAAIFISIMYTVGLTQLLIFENVEVMKLTPMQLMLSCAVIILFLRPWTSGTIFSLLSIYSLGLGIEILGVQTGFPFGEYTYGSILGPKIAGTPLLIGVNWVLVIVGSITAARRLFPTAPKILRTAISASLALFLDILIEPVAVALDMWTWTSGEIPRSNYIAWWILAAVFSYIYQKWGNTSAHWVVIVVFIWLIIFFSSLNFLYI